ncbi:MAG: hypothetical protein ABIH76_05505, partial [Candidatus Bathyarchaeota archaeon]
MQTRLLQYFLENRTRIFNQAGLARFLNCSPSTISRLLEPFIKEGLVVFEQISGQMKIIALNTESDKVKILIEFYEKIKSL